MPIEAQDSVLDTVRMGIRFSHLFPLGDYGRGATLLGVLAASGGETKWTRLRGVVEIRCVCWQDKGTR